MKKFFFALFCSALWPLTSFADAGDIVGAADNVIDITGMMSKTLGAAIVCIGLAFFCSGLLKIKYHYDNPTQVPLVTAVLMILFSLALFALAFLSYYMDVKIFG